jgi:starvation-inducible DNA-binding protein
MKTNISLNDDVRREIGQLLNQNLADEYVIYTAAHDFHWNITGPQFRTLHAMFDELYEESHARLDSIAERARAIGSWARGNWAELTRAARLSSEPGAAMPAEEMIAAMLALHEDAARQLRVDIETCERLQDAGTTDFLTGVLEEHEKSAWMLRAMMEDEAGESKQ